MRFREGGFVPPTAKPNVTKSVYLGVDPAEQEIERLKEQIVTLQGQMREAFERLDRIEGEPQE